MPKRNFKVAITAIVEVSLDTSLLPDDEWRSTFYSHIHTMDDLAGHVAYNVAANNVQYISQLDGWADRNPLLMTFKINWEEPEVLS